MSTSRYIEIRPDNIPADGKVSFKNGFPVLSFTISAQDGLLDPRSIRIVGDFAVFKNNARTPVVNTDGLTMNNRLGIYNVIDTLTVRSVRSKMICESIRHYAKYMNSYISMTSSLQDQVGHFGETCLIMPNSQTFRKSVVESRNTDAVATNSFSFHLPCGFVMSGQFVNLRPDAFGGVQIEFNLMPDSNVLYAENGSSAGLTEAFYELSNLKLCCEVQDIPPGELTSGESEGMYEFNTITSLYTSINSTNAQLQYNLAQRNVLSAFLTFMPVSNINTLTADGQATTYPSGKGASATALAFFKRIQFLKGGSKFPADFDYVNSITKDANGTLPDPQIVKTFIEAIHPEGGGDKLSISPVNCNRSYDMATAVASSSYAQIPEGGGVIGLGVKYGLSGQGEDFSTEQWGVSIESELDRNNPIGVYIFIKSKAQLIYNSNGIQLLQ